MATNDFLPFAGAAGANVLAQAAYAALPAVSTGYGAGIAKSEQVNKTLRQSSIMSAVLAQFIVNQTGQNATDDGTTATLIANLISAVKNTSLPHGQCVLSSTGTTNLTLYPMNGNNLVINGVVQQVPAGGVSYTLSGTAASTTYNVYAYMNGANIALELSTVGHTATTNGVEVKSGDATRTLVGKVFTSASNTLLDNGTNRTIISWFNRKLKAINTGAVNNSTSSTSAVLLGIACTFLTWSADSFQAQLSGIANNSTVNNGASVSVLLDGSAGAYTSSQVVSNPASGSQTICSIVSGSLAEGAHTLQAQGAAITGGNATFSLTITGFILG